MNIVEPEIIRSYYPNGNIYTEEYFINGIYHRGDGPAYIGYYTTGSIKYEEYLFNGRCHREDGPAWTQYYANGSINFEKYYLNGEEITDDLQLLMIQTLELVK
jgi:antitoxin component YwqK of YwqJK toxin-antitoxin module